MKPGDLLPLQEPTFFILTSLAAGKKHGYAILKDVEALSAGRTRLGTGTLYGALGRLLDQGLITQVDDPAGSSGDYPGKPRKAYALTQAGRKVLLAETERLSALASAARLRLGEESL